MIFFYDCFLDFRVSEPEPPKFLLLAYPGLADGEETALAEVGNPETNVIATKIVTTANNTAVVERADAFMQSSSHCKIRPSGVATPIEQRSRRRLPGLGSGMCMGNNGRFRSKRCRPRVRCRLVAGAIHLPGWRTVGLAALGRLAQVVFGADLVGNNCCGPW